MSGKQGEKRHRRTGLNELGYSVYMSDTNEQCICFAFPLSGPLLRTFLELFSFWRLVLFRHSVLAGLIACSFLTPSSNFYEEMVPFYT
jgi:hypothetical protein